MKTILILLLAFNVSSQSSWNFTYDKQQHVYIGSAISIMAYPIITYYEIGGEPKPIKGLFLSIGISSSVTVTKELVDLAGFGHASIQDLTYGVGGAVVSSLTMFGILNGVELIKKRVKRNKLKL